MSSVKPWETLASCFVVDFTQPYFVSIGPSIFDLTNDDVTMVPRPKADSEITSVSSDESTSDSFSASVKISGSYGCFSGSASMGIDTSSSMTKHTMRTDVKVTASNYHVSGSTKFMIEPSTFVNADLKKYITAGTISMEQLEQIIGHFYCSSCRLGGIFQKSYIVETSSKDTKLSVQAKLKASYGAGLTSCSAEASVGMKTSKHNKNARMRIEQECLGGDASIWLGATATNSDEVQAKWAASVKDDNLFALDMDLDFSWTLVEALNPTLGAKYKKHLEEKWAKQAASSNVHALVYVEEGGKYGGAKVKVKSWQGDYLHRPDSGSVTTHSGGGIGDTWTVEETEDGKIMLKSWKGDHLHRPDSGNVTTHSGGGIGDTWTIEEAEDGKIMLKSWKGDHLHRPSGAASVTTFSKHGIGNVWSIEIVA